MNIFKTLKQLNLPKFKSKLTSNSKPISQIKTPFENPHRFYSKPTTIPKKQQRVRDHGFDNYMEIQKKLKKVLKFQDLILSQPHQCIPISLLDTYARRLGFKSHESGKFLLKFPCLFQLFEHPVQRILFFRMTQKALLLIEQERLALEAQIPEAVTRLRKLLMLSNSGRVLLEHVRIARKDFGLPDDFEYSVVLKYPEYFRLFDCKDSWCKYIEIVDKDPRLGVCSVEKVREMEYRHKGVDEESVRFSFVVNFPPGFKLGKYYKIAMWKWQRLPYWSPYEDINGYDMRSSEAQSRMEKRAVAMIHEFLSLTVEKKISLERIAHFRLCLDLPNKLKDFLLQHQGIFYISTRGNQGKLHTIFLREAYRRGELIEPNDLYLACRRLAQLVLVSPRKAPMDDELIGYGRSGLDHYRSRDLSMSTQTLSNVRGKARGNGVKEQISDSELNSDTTSGLPDEDDDFHHVKDKKATNVSEWVYED